MSLTKKVHSSIKTLIQPGAMVVDATVGNGVDCCFLAELVGKQGHVYGFDIQEQAIVNTIKRLEKAELIGRVTLFQVSHHCCAEVLPKLLYGNLVLAMFNLGYLPQGDKGITTGAKTSCQALEQLKPLLAHHGVISVVAYRGHYGGEDEYHQVLAWASQLPSTEYRVDVEISDPERDDSPVWILIQRL